MELLVLTNMLALTCDAPLFWLVIVKSMVRLLCFVHYVRMIQKPSKRITSYYQFLDCILDLIIIGLYLFADFVMQRLCQDIKELQRQTKLMAKLRKKFEVNNNRLLKEKENRSQSLSTKLNRVEYELETKEANYSVLSNSFRELIVQQGMIIEANQSLQEELQSSNIKLKQLEKQSEEAFLQYDHLLANKENELQSLSTRLNQVKYELETKAKDVIAKGPHTNVLSHLWRELLTVVEDNQRLQKQLQSSDIKLKQLRDVVKASEDKVIALNKQSEEAFREYDRIIAVKDNELQSLADDRNGCEADAKYMRSIYKQLLTDQDLVAEENRSLKSRLQSCFTVIKQRESEIETKTKDLRVAEAKIIDMKEEIATKTTDLRVAEAKLIDSNKNPECCFLGYDSIWEIITHSQAG